MKIDYLLVNLLPASLLPAVGAVLLAIGVLLLTNLLTGLLKLLLEAE